MSFTGIGAPDVQSTSTPPMVELQPGDEVNNQRVSAVAPVMRYVVHLHRKAEVTISLKESNTASRCVVYLSPTDPEPTAQNATWRNETSDPKKTIVLLPIDPEWRDGPCFIVVRYVASSGTAFFSLRIQVQDKYVASWVYPKTLSTYEGEWLNHLRHGSGRALYYPDADTLEQFAPRGESTVSESMQSSAAKLGTKLMLQASQGRAAALAGSDDGDEHHEQQQRDGGDDDDARGAAQDLLSTMRQLKRQQQQALLYSSTAAGSPGLEASIQTQAASSPKMDRMSATGAPPLNDIPCHACACYQGEWRHGAKDGHGVYTWPDKKYEGYWRGGRRYGKGTLTRHDGSVFNGEWREDAMNGYGVQQYGNGTRYEGEWVKNKRHGRGVFHYRDGIVITGQWECDVLKANVTVKYPNGDVYEGGWQNDLCHGKGTLKDAQNLTYDGEFSCGKKHGQGTWSLPRSVRFVGEWIEDVRVASTGKFIFPSTDVYQGDWDATRHVRHGRGTCTYSNGDVYQGDWRDDERSGKGVLVTGGGGGTLPIVSAVPGGGMSESPAEVATGGAAPGEKLTYEGEFLSNLRHGWGRMTMGSDPSDGFYEGQWARDQRHGDGKCLYSDGTLYVGAWLHDQRHGQGTMTAPDGSWSYIGQWSGDHRHGRGRLEQLHRVDAAATTGAADAVGGTTATSTSKRGSIAGHHSHLEPAAGGGGSVSDRGSGIIIGQGAGGSSSKHSSIAAASSPIGPHEKWYDGEWREGRRHGDGTVLYTDGNTFSGSWKDNHRMDGPGTMHYANGASYTGSWRHDERHGRGGCTFPDGTRYDGEWQHDQQHGEGMLVLSNGDTFYGRWSHGQRQDGEGKCVYANGNVYTGEWFQGKPHGRGALSYVGDDVTFEGRFVNGEYRL